jgi:glycosyltransferase involved in cell wall biosynthesis
VVVDSGSNDRTIHIAKDANANVFHREWNGYGPQKQFALEQAKGPWILNLDADERLSPDLKEEIRIALSGSELPNGFEIPFRHYFLKSRLRFGGAAGETHLRLFRKDRGSYGQKKIHEGITVTPPLGRLKSPIDHFSYRDMAEYLEKCNRYTSLIAEEKFASGARFSPLHHFRLPYEFVVRYVVKLGFLDGAAGLVYAALSSYYVWLKYLKLRDLEAGSKEKRT